MYMLVRSFEPPNLPFRASMLSIRTASMPFTCYFETKNHPIFHSRPVCYLYVLPMCHVHAGSKLRTTQSSIPGQYVIYTYSSMPFTCCFEASNHPIFHSRQVCYLYVLPVCHLHATSKLRTTQSSIPGQYAICRYSSMPCTCSLEASNHPIFHSGPVCYLYVLPVCHLHATSKLRTTQSSIPGQYAIYRYSSMPCTCSLEASNHPIFHSGPVCYLYVLPVCHLHAASKLRTTQSSIPGHYAIDTYCQYAIYMLLRSFEPPNLPFPASMLSIRIASMPFTCCFEASNHPIFHSRPVCYLYVLQYAIYMLLRSFEQPNLSFPVSMLSIRTPVCHLHVISKLRTTQSSIPGQYAICRYSSMPCTCSLEASNHPIFHSGPVCYLYVLQYAIYMLLQSFEPPNLPFPASMLSIRTPVCHVHAP